MRNQAGSLAEISVAFAEIIGKRDEQLAMWTVRSACRDEKFWNAHAKNDCWSNRTQSLRPSRLQRRKIFDGIQAWLKIWLIHYWSINHGCRINVWILTGDKPMQYKELPSLMANIYEDISLFYVVRIVPLSDDFNGLPKNKKSISKRPLKTIQIFDNQRHEESDGESKEN